MKRPGAFANALAMLARRWLVALSLGALFAVLAARSGGRPIDDPDVWWIAASGRDMLATFRPPLRNLHSFTSPDHPWVMHELVFGLVYALGMGAMGPAFVPLLSLLLAAAVAVVAAGTIGARARHPASVVLALFLVLAGAGDALFAPRPSHASLVLPVVMTALAFRPGWSSIRTAAAVLVEALWTNTHGSFPLGVAILAAGAFDQGETRRVKRQRLGCAALAALATLVSPYGARLHALVAGYLGAGGAESALLRRHIVEFFPIWRSAPPFVNPMNVMALAFLASLSLSAILRRRHLSPAALSIGLLVLAAYQARHTTLAVVLGGIVLHPEIDGRCVEAAPAREPMRPRSLAAAALLPGMALGILLWWMAARERSREEWIAAAIGGPELAHLTEDLPAGANVYAPFQSSGLVLWLGAPRAVRVFFDSRNDCYPADVAEAAFALERAGSPRFTSEILDRYDTRFALVPDSHPVYQALVAAPEWSLWRSNGHWHGFERRLAR